MQKIFRTILLTLAISHVLADIPLDNIPFNIYESSSTSFEDAVRKKIDKAISEVKVFSDAAKVGSIIPYIDTVMGPISDGLETLQSNIWEETLIKAIAEESRRMLIDHTYTDIRSHCISVSQGLETLSRGLNVLSTSEKSSQVQIFYEKLKDINNIFVQKSSIFRKYPEFAYVPLTMLASITAILDPIFQEFSPSVSQNSFMSCQLRDNLIEFRELLVWRRLESLMVKTEGVKGKNDINNKMIYNVTLRDYERYGYNRTNKNAIECMVGCYFYSGIASVRDPVAGIRYCAFASGPDVENCIVGYAELLRSRIENAYRDSIELITSRCNQDVMNRRRPTGYGYWSVNLIGMEGQTKRNSDISCDPDLFSKGPFTYCDLYSQIYINDNLVFTSSKGSNENEHYTNEKFMSSKIKDDSIIRFELWDADARDDDICLQVTKNLNEVKHFRGKIQEGNNFIVLSTFWRRSYVDDGQIS